MSDTPSSDSLVPNVEIPDIQAAARRWAHARREARRWSAEADRLGEMLIPAMELTQLHGVAGEDWVVRVARRPRYFGVTPERLREVLGPETAALYLRTVIDWGSLIADYGENVTERLGATQAETPYLVLATRKEGPGETGDADLS
jgi:hypothetical protein